jgi:hypothetical protein
VTATDWVVAGPGKVHGFPVPSPDVSGRLPPSLSTRVHAPSRVVRPLRSNSSPSTARCPAPAHGLATVHENSASSFQGFWLPLRDVSRRRPLLGRSSHAPTSTVRPRRFSRPRRFAPPPAFAGLFHPAATSRVSLQGVLPHRGAAPAFAGLLPSARLDLRTCGLTRASTQGPGFRAFDSPRWMR